MYKRPTPALNKLEAFFNMPLKDIVLKLHWEQGISQRDLCFRAGVSRDTLNKNAEKLNLKLRTLKEATKLTKNKGKNHWAYGISRPECSARMKKDNPSYNNDNLVKAAKTHALNFRKNPLPQENTFINFLDSFGVKYIFQYPVDRYIIDFLIPSISLCIEIDSTDKWGSHRKERALIKDTFLLTQGYSILRIPRLKLNDPLYIKNVLLANNVIADK